MIDEETIARAVDLLREAAKPHRIILFGSYASGHPREDSDVDFLVVEDDIRDIVAEMVRLRRVLSPLRIPVDILVTRREDYADWSDTPGNVLHHAAVEGKVVYEAT